MSGLNKQNADQAYQNLRIYDRAVINLIVAKAVESILNNSGQLDTDTLVATTLVANSITAISLGVDSISADSLSANSLSANSYSSPITNVSVSWQASTMNVQNNALVGSITLTSVNQDSTETKINVTNDNVSENDLVFLTQHLTDESRFFDQLFVLSLSNGNFTIKTETNSTSTTPSATIKIGYLIIKNTL